MKRAHLIVAVSIAAVLIAVHLLLGTVETEVTPSVARAPMVLCLDRAEAHPVAAAEALITSPSAARRGTVAWRFTDSSSKAADQVPLVAEALNQFAREGQRFLHTNQTCTVLIPVDCLTAHRLQNCIEPSKYFIKLEGNATVLTQLQPLQRLVLRRAYGDSPAKLRFLLRSLMEEHATTGVTLCGLQEAPLSLWRLAWRLARLDFEQPDSPQPTCDPITYANCRPMPAAEAQQCLRYNIVDRNKTLQKTPMSRAALPVDPKTCVLRGLHQDAKSPVVLVSLPTSNEDPGIILDNLLAWLHYCGSQCAVVVDSTKRMDDLATYLKEQRPARLLFSNECAFLERSARASGAMRVVLVPTTLSDRISNGVAQRHLRNVRFALDLLRVHANSRVLFAAVNELPFRTGLPEHVLSHSAVDLQDLLSAAPEAQVLHPSFATTIRKPNLPQWHDVSTFGQVPRPLHPAWALTQSAFIRGAASQLQWLDFTPINQFCNAGSWDRMVEAGYPIASAPVAFEGLWMSVEDFAEVERHLDTTHLWDFMTPLEHVVFSPPLLHRHHRFVRRSGSLAPAAEPNLGRNTCIHIPKAYHKDVQDEEPDMALAVALIEAPPPDKFTLKRVSKEHFDGVRGELRRRRALYSRRPTEAKVPRFRRLSFTSWLEVLHRR